MNDYLITLTGKDQTGIVAAVTQALYQQQISLGETSMLRLGGNFTIMMAVKTQLDQSALEQILQPVCQKIGLSLHIDPLNPDQVPQEPNCSLHIYGADRAGIIAEVTQKLAEQGFNILDLESAISHGQEAVYILMITGYSPVSLSQLKSALQPLLDKGIQIQINEINTLVG